MNGLALCAGVGGIELGLRLAMPDYRTVCYVEREAYAAATLVRRMEDGCLAPAPVWDDLATFDGRPWRGRVHLVSSGFPCQPFSTAGLRRGLKDERWLWPHIERIIREIRPQAVFLENVPQVRKDALSVVLGSLAALGFHAEWDVFSAAGSGAPHQRKRLFLLAHAPRVGRIPRQNRLGQDSRLGSNATTRSSAVAEPNRIRRDAGRAGQSSSRSWLSGKVQSVANPQCYRHVARRKVHACVVPAQRGERPLSAFDARSRAWWSVEPDVGRMADGVAARVDRLQACGNGVVPQVAARAWRVLMARLLE